MMSSPIWKNPSDLMKKRVAKKRLSVNNSQVAGKPSPRQPKPHIKSPVAKKRRNPFGLSHSSPKKKRSTVKTEVEGQQKFQVSNDNEGALPSNEMSKLSDVNSLTMDQKLSFVEKLEENKQVSGANCSLTMDQELSSVEKDEENKHNTGQVSQSTDNRYPFFPLDWCLKTKVRFMSRTAFSWAGQLKSKEEANGIHQFITAPFQPTADETKCVNLKENESCVKSALKRCSMCWIHPNLPWFKPFPRIAPDKSIGMQTLLSQDADVQKSLLTDWTESFASIFQLYRAECCPYFYVCSHQFTVLFRHSQTGSTEVLMTPTSRGLREAIKDEGVEFTMPLNPLNKLNIEDDISAEVSSNCTDSDLTKDTEENQPPKKEDNVERNDDITGTDEGASSWLATLGLDKSKYRSLDPNKVKLQRDIYRTIDNRPESLVLIDGAGHTFALYNFLLNCRTCIAVTGTQAGIPPTLLAPTAFRGATLKALTTKAGTIRHQQLDGSIQQLSSLEVSGPLLPSTLSHLQTLLSKVQGSYVASYSIHEPTTPFNAGATRKAQQVEKECDQQSSPGAATPTATSPQDDVAFPGAVRGICLDEEVVDGKCAMRDLDCQNGSYCWTKGSV